MFHFYGEWRKERERKFQRSWKFARSPKEIETKKTKEKAEMGIP